MPAVLSKNGSDSELSPEQERAQALALLDAGCDAKYVAKYLNKSERWVRKWRQRRDVRQGLADKHLDMQGWRLAISPCRLIRVTI